MKFVGVLLAALVFAAPASASSKQLWHESFLDPVASAVAGMPLTVGASDNVAEWNLVTHTDVNSPYEVLGFTYPFAQPGAVFYDPYDGRFYYMYREVWISPRVRQVFVDIAQSGLAAVDPNRVAVALMTLDHEAWHQRLQSLDESRVNACALADMPRLLTANYGVPTSIQQTVPMPQTHTVKVRYRIRVRHHGHWVIRWRTKLVTKTTYVDMVETVPNPLYVGILSAAQAFYVSQPPPYNAGTC